MRSFICFVLVMVGTLYLAISYSSTAIMLVFYAEVVYAVLSFVWLLFRRRTVKGRLEVPVGIAEPRKDVSVRLVITNRSRLPIQRMKVFVTVADDIGGAEKRTWMKMAEAVPGETEFVCSISFPVMGNYVLTLKKLRIYDMAGLLYGTVAGKSSACVQVLPTLHEMPVRLTAATRNFYGESDVYDAHSPGHDNNEVFQIREYRAGDRLQNVHWKLTAKQEELMVKEHSLPKSCPVVLFLKYCPKKGRKRKASLVLYMEAAVSISFSMMAAGCPHYVVWYDGNEQDLQRLRVEDEESLFYCIGLLMRLCWKMPKEDLIERYKEKYHQEPYVWEVSLDEKLTLKKAGEVLTVLSGEALGEALAQTELLL